MSQQKQRQKPSLRLLKGDKLTTENLAALNEKLKGKNPTREQLRQARKLLGK